jgi:hypothetical protein
MKSRDQMICTNCKAPLNGVRHVFQGVIICDNCHKLVSHAIKRTQGELQMLFLVYTDMIRVGLLKGEFRPPPMPSPGKSMPPSELAKSLASMIQGASNATDRESPVSSLQSCADNTDGEVPPRRRAAPLSGRR